MKNVEEKIIFWDFTSKNSLEYENRFSLIYATEKHKSVFIENYINIQQGQNHIQNTYKTKYT